MRELAGKADDRTDATEAHGDLEEPRPIDDPLARLIGVRLYAHHDAGSPRLVEVQVAPWVILEPRVVDATNLRPGAQEFRDPAGVHELPVEPHGERLHAAQQEPRLEGTQARAFGVLDPIEFLAELRVRHRDDAGGQVGVARQRLGCRLDHDVGAELERLL